MFKLDKEQEIQTFNPFHGCRYHCYEGKCWARGMAQRLGTNPVITHYDADNPFAPAEAPEKWGESFNGGTVFIGSMGDLAWQPREVMQKTVNLIKRNPGTRFLLCTKNPEIYLGREWPGNVLLGSTIETNRDEGYSRFSNAPVPSRRLSAMKRLTHPYLHVSMEPVMKFDPDEMVPHLEEIGPEVVSVGYGNYGTPVPEPELPRVKDFIESVEIETGAVVERKTLRESRN